MSFDGHEERAVNLRTIIAATPWLRRAWRLTPGPLRIPLLLVALVVGARRLFGGRGKSGGQR